MWEIQMRAPGSKRNRRNSRRREINYDAGRIPFRAGFTVFLHITPAILRRRPFDRCARLRHDPDAAVVRPPH